MYYNDSDQARESGLRRAFVESMQELMKCVNTLAAGAAEKAYCYLNLCGMDVFTGCFFVDGNGRASLSSALLGKKQGIFETVMTTQARKLRGAYIEYADDIPGEFFLDFDIGAKKPHCLTGSDKYPKHDEALLHFYSWAREYGADDPAYRSDLGRPYPYSPGENAAVCRVRTPDGESHGDEPQVVQCYGEKNSRGKGKV